MLSHSEDHDGVAHGSNFLAIKYQETLNVRTFFSENISTVTLSAGLSVDIQVFKLEAKLLRCLSEKPLSLGADVARSAAKH